MNRRGAALVVPLLVSWTAPSLAQVSIVQHDLSRRTFSSADCAGAEVILRRRLRFEGDGVPTFRLQERLVERETVRGIGACPAPDREGTDVLPEQQLTFSNVDYTDEVRLPPVQLMPPTACTAGLRSTETALCLYIFDLVGALVAAHPAPVSFDTAVPDKARLTSVRPGDRRVSFAVGGVDRTQGDEYRYVVLARACETLDGGGSLAGDAGEVEDAAEVDVSSACGATGPFEQRTFRSPDISLTGLENDVMYEVRVLVRDDFGNTGEPSDAITFIPRRELGPLDLYDGAGSPYSFAPSCGASSTSGSAWLLFLALGALFFFRRRRAVSCSLAAVLALLAAAPEANAYPGQVHVNLRGGPYLPAIDTEMVNGRRIFPVYRCFFADSVLPELGFDVNFSLFDGFGSLEAGFGLLGAQAQGRSQPLESGDPANQTLGRCAEPAEGRVELTVVKLRPHLTYRFDYLLDTFGVPLVPYGRAGVVAAGYAFTREGLPPESRTAKPFGVVFGYEGALGLQLALGFLDAFDPFTPFTMRRARANNVLEHVFLFGEVLYQDVTNFGRPGLVLSPQDPLFGSERPLTVQLGIALEIP